MRQIKHRLMRAASWLPDRILRFGVRHWPAQDYDGWNFWLDASYWQYVRKDKRENP